MKIAVLSSHTPSLMCFRLDMMLSFCKLGHDVVAIGNEPENEWTEKFSAYGIKYRQVEVQRNGTNPIKDIKTLSSIKKVLKEEKPDKLFTYQAKTIVYGGIAARILKISEVYPLIAGVGSVFLSNGFKIRMIRAILTVQYKIAMKRSPNVFFQNTDDLDVFVNNKIIKREKAVIINGSGVNLDKFTEKSLPEKFAFLFIGRLIRDKGIIEYLEAAAKVKGKHPDVRFLLVGPFDTNPTAIKKEDLQIYTDKGIVEYFGEQSDVRSYLEECSVFVLPSYREGTPKTILEAMATRRAIITTDATGCRETVAQGVNGYLVPVKDVNALAEKMESLINDPEAVVRMATEGRRLVETKYDVNLVNQTIIDTMNI